MTLDFLLRHGVRTGESLALDMVIKTFDAMRRGGLYDQVGGGLHRYSVDAEWLVPHFEKMLYDNALFARLGVRLWQVTHDDDVKAATVATLDWAMLELRDEGGGFQSSLDADSEGHEGRFYVWTREEFTTVCGADADVAEAHWGVSEDGNFEGRNILFVPDGYGATAARTGKTMDEVRAAVSRARDRLYEVRSRRSWPSKDGKVIASWNGLMIRAFCEAARAFDREDYRKAAERAGEFLRGTLMRDGRVFRSALAGRISGPGMLEDFAAVGLAFVDLYSLTFDPSWLADARAIAGKTVELFLDTESDTWYDTASDHEALIVRPREVTDNATPSGTSLVAELLLTLADLDNRADWREMAERTVARVGDVIAQHPQALGHAAGIADTVVHGGVQVAIVGPDPRPLVRTLGNHFVPGLALAGGETSEDSGPALLKDRLPIGGATTAFVCRGFVCDLPATEPEVLARQLSDLIRDGRSPLDAGRA
jgi:uncharacterized protein YyaL (SSP411 family)